MALDAATLKGGRRDSSLCAHKQGLFGSTMREGGRSEVESSAAAAALGYHCHYYLAVHCVIDSGFNIQCGSAAPLDRGQDRLQFLDVDVIPFEAI